MELETTFRIIENLMNKFCDYGCGREVMKEENRFINGHNGNRRGKTNSEESNRKRSES